MAKTSAANTGGSQFFIIDANTTADWLNGVHTVFGTVVEGQSAVESIASVSTEQNDKPTVDVVILRALLLILITLMMTQTVSSIMMTTVLMRRIPSKAIQMRTKLVMHVTMISMEME